jgi:hypothetical protein
MREKLVNFSIHGFIKKNKELNLVKLFYKHVLKKNIMFCFNFLFSSFFLLTFRFLGLLSSLERIL